MVQRVTYRRRHAYATKSNKTKLVKTPGGRLSVHYRTKRAAHPRCPITGAILNGLPAVRPAKNSNSVKSKNKKTVHRAYGGVLSHGAVRERIIRAFLIEEQKIVKRVLKLQQKETA